MLNSIVELIGNTPMVKLKKEKGMTGTIDKGNEMKAENPNYFIPSQFDNESNSKAHYLGTGVEIFKELPDINAFVAGVGTGGTLGGIAKYLKEQNKNIQVTAVEPTGSAVLSGEASGPHKIQGIGAGFRYYINRSSDKNER